MKYVLAALFLSAICLAQDYSASKVSCNAVPLSFVTMKQVTSGIETDMVLAVTHADGIGESTIVAKSSFVGVRYERTFPALAKWIQNHSELAGYNFQFGVALTPGLVKTPTVLHWGERASLFMKYSPANNKNFALGLEAGWNNLPGIQHNTASVSVGPNFKW